MKFFLNLIFYFNYKPNFFKKNIFFHIYIKNFIFFLFFFYFFNSKIKLLIKKKKIYFQNIIFSPNRYKKAQKNFFLQRYELNYSINFYFKNNFLKNYFIYFYFFKKNFFFFESSLIFFKSIYFYINQNKFIF